MVQYYITTNLFQVKYPTASDGHQACITVELRIFDLRGIRQISVQARLLGLLPAGINRKGEYTK